MNEFPDVPPALEKEGVSQIAHPMISYLTVLTKNWEAQHKKQAVWKISMPESQLLEAMRVEGMRPECQYDIGPYTLDFFFPDELVCVEVDGKQHQEPDAVERDRRRDAYLGSKGIYTIRVRTDLIRRNAPNAARSIGTVLRRMQRRPA